MKIPKHIRYLKVDFKPKYMLIISVKRYYKKFGWLNYSGSKTCFKTLKELNNRLKKEDTYYNNKSYMAKDKEYKTTFKKYKLIIIK